MASEQTVDEHAAFLERQDAHFEFVLLCGVLFGWETLVSFSDLHGRCMDLSARSWLWLSLLVPIAHQIYVWLSWRSELLFNWWTDRFGDRGFTYYATGFAILGISRLLTVTGLALASSETAEIRPWIRYPLAIFASLAFLYLMYSVVRYFGFKRAMGIDHFDLSYRDMPFVRQGIFRYSSNAMYRFGFLGMWVPGLLTASAPALWVALFSHIYIWVHYYCTELPDIRRIYGSK